MTPEESRRDEAARWLAQARKDNVTYFAEGKLVCINCGAANPGCSRLLAGALGARTLADGPKSRLKGGCGQDCPPHNLRRIVARRQSN
jgi:hypothetical protein